MLGCGGGRSWEKVSGHKAGESGVWFNSWSLLNLMVVVQSRRISTSRKHGTCFAQDASEMGGLVRGSSPVGF